MHYRFFLACNRTPLGTSGNISVATALAIARNDEEAHGGLAVDIEYAHGGQWVPYRTFQWRERPSDRLSRAVSELTALFREMDATADDISAFGGDGDCARIVYRMQQRKARNILARHRFTPHAFELALEARVSARWLYASGVGSQLAALLDE